MVYRLPRIHDVARLSRPTVEETTSAIVSHWNESYPTWNYDPSQQRSPLIMAATVSKEWVCHSCDNIKHEIARKANSDVLQLVWEQFSPRKIRTYLVKERLVNLTPTLLLPIKLTCQFTENRNATLFWLQPRRSFALTLPQLGFLAGVIRETYCIDDYENAAVEFLDLSAPDKKSPRLPRVWRSTELKVAEIAEIEHVLTIFAAAYEKAIALGLKRPRRPSKRKPGGMDDLFAEDNSKKK